MPEKEPSPIEDFGRKIQIITMAGIIRERRTAVARSEDDPAAYDRADEFASWLTPEELEEAARIADEADDIDPRTMVDELMKRIEDMEE
jgi:hypothetical protein